MSQITIDKNVPLPPAHRGRPFNYPFDAMAVGDSFFVPCENADAKKRRNVLKTLCRRMERLRRGTFTTRIVEGGVRVWKTAEGRAAA